MPHAWLRRGSTTALATLLVVTPATMASAAPGDGIGDPYFPSYGNTGYDVDHYDLDLDYTPKNDKLTGTATLDAEATEDLDAFTLDFLLDVESVEVNGEKAEHEKSGEHKVQITPAASVAKGESLTVVVKYSGVPSKATWDGATGVGWHRTDNGAVVMGEPEAAPWWFPANDHPRDKATLDVKATVPKGTTAVGNGVLADESSEGDTTTFTWKQDKPAATYLATLAIGKYEVTKGETSDGVPIYNAYSDTLDANEKKRAKDSVEKGEEIIDFESGVFGPYPYNALGGIVEGPDAKPELGGALETQTRPVYSNAFFEDEADPYVVAHELAHQWWGDQVSVDRWQDIWLNEGFASYAEWMWSEDQGHGTAQELADKTYDSYPSDDDFWQVKPGDPGPDNVFHPAVYDRGALAVHALRKEVGDDAFFDILATWQEENAHGNARIEDFITLSEKISGQQLDELFDTWLYTKGKPEAQPSGKSAVSTKPGSADPESWRTIHDNHQRMAQQHG